jgi:benzil reductase ((S)-benzoin forming)
MHSRVVDAEQKLTDKNRVRVFSIGPGIVDTQMQENIRKSSKNDFSKTADFVNYKNTGQLASPDLVSSNLFRILDKIEQLDKVVFSVKDL